MRKFFKRPANWFAVACAANIVMVLAFTPYVRLWLDLWKILFTEGFAACIVAELNNAAFLLASVWLGINAGVIYVVAGGYRYIVDGVTEILMRKRIGKTVKKEIV
jgi:hypothetical protein